MKQLKRLLGFAIFAAMFGSFFYLVSLIPSGWIILVQLMGILLCVGVGTLVVVQLCILAADLINGDT